MANNLHKITHNYMKNRGSTPILINLAGIQPRNINSKVEANPCSSLGEVEKVKINSYRHDDNDYKGHRVIAKLSD